MKLSDRAITVFVMLYFFIVIAQSVFLLLYFPKMESDYAAVSRVTGEIRFCNNNPPEFNYNCNLSVYQDETFYCAVDSIDLDSDDLTFQMDSLIPYWDFDIISSGVMDFTPNATQINNYSFVLMVQDSSGCNNGYDVDTFDLEVINVNDAPILIQNISNQSWDQDTDLVDAFDLDDFYIDYDGDPLNYTYTLLENIAVIIDDNHVVSFSPITGWSGTEIVYFFAWDPYYANASSNPVLLEVIARPETSSSSSSSSSSSGGGGGGGTFPSCIPKWYCRPWGPCEPDGIMRRECYDLNNCSTEIGKPNITLECEFISTCYDGFKGPGEEGVDCGGPCPACGSCYDQICNNAEDCTKGVTDIPDCGGPCQECPEKESPRTVTIINWGMIFLLLVLLGLIIYAAKTQHKKIVLYVKRKKKKYYEEKLMLETKISQNIFESLLNLEKILGEEDIENIIVMFSSIVRNYFKELLGLDYEFTYQELIKVIDSKNVNEIFKNVLLDFFNRSLEIEFSGKSVSKEEMKATIQEFRHLLAYTSEIVPETTTTRQRKGLNKIESLFNKINKAESLLVQNKINEAYELYLEIYKQYEKVNDKDKKRLHGFISRLYEEIKLERQKQEIIEEKSTGEEQGLKQQENNPDKTENISEAVPENTINETQPRKKDAGLTEEELVSDMFFDAAKKHRENRLDEAKKVYEDILGINPEHKESLYYLASLFNSQKNYKASLRLYKKILEIDPEYKDVKRIFDILKKKL